MLRHSRLLSIILSVSFLLAPWHQLHAHITGANHEHMEVHGGHTHGSSHARHDVDHGRSGTHGHVLDLQPDLSQGQSGSLTWLKWIALACVVAIIVCDRRLLAFGGPPRIRTRPPDSYPHAWPPLRGPPSST